MFSRASNKGGERRNGASSLSVIAADCKIEGTVVSDGEIQLDGTIKGDLKGDTVVIGASGSIEGTITGALVRVLGSVKGQISASAVELAKTAFVRGDILQDSLSIAAGAVVEGRFDRLSTPTPAEEIKALPPRDPETSDL